MRLVLLTNKHWLRTMYVCICKGITDSDIRNAVADGADSMQSIRQQTGVSTQCGQCSSLAKMVFKEALEESAEQCVFYAA